MADSQEVTADQSAEAATKTAAPDLSEITNALKAEFDSRFQGFQSLLDRRTSEWQRELESLKTADLSPEEQEQHVKRQEAQRITKLERENQLLRMRKQFPEEVDLLESFFEADSLETQLDILSKFRKAQAEAEAQGADTTGQPTPVDKNNPPSRKQELSLADMEEQMTSELAEKILGQSNQKGILRRLRGG
jgi:hypothetical protein